jgi:hypothetical protein
MAESLFLFGKDNILKKIDSSEFVTEDEFQKLLAQFPDLLTDADFGEGTPRRWMLVTREAPVSDSADGSGRWSLDHLFLDQDAVPTLVEVKRATDTRARREVVAQMLDYAANAVSWWKADDLERLFAKSCEEIGITQQARLAQLLRTDEPDTEAFWRSVQSNLTSGRIRLIFVADRVALELATIIQFMNEQMRYATVLALELRHFSNGSERILAPRLIGITPRVTARRTIVPAAASMQEWFAEFLSPPAQPAVERFIDMMQALGGSAKVAGQSLALEYGPDAARVVYVRPNGRPSLSLYQLAKTRAFASDESRSTLLDRFDAAGFAPSTRKLLGEPSFSLPNPNDEQRWASLRTLFDEIARMLAHGGVNG